MNLRSKFLDKCLILIFIVLIFIPCLGLFIKTNSDEIQSMMNRKPYIFPKINIKKIHHTNFTEIENWFGDKVLFVRSMGKLWGYINYKLGVSAKPESTIIGKDGWLFLGNGNELTIDQFTGKNAPTEEETKLQINAFKHMNKVAVQNQIPFLVIIAPDKQDVYPEYLPRHIHRGEVPTRLDRLMQGLLANNIDFIDLREDELRAKNTLGKKYGALYHKADSHWNYLGAYVAYQSIAKYLNLKGIETNKLQFDFYLGSNKAQDLAAFIQLTNLEPQTFLPNITNLKINLQGTDISGINHDLSPYDGNDLNIILKAPYQNINRELKNKQVCLLISDSFSNALGFYFHNDFYNTVRIHPDNTDYSLAELIKTYHPNIIIFEKVERGLLGYANNFMGNPAYV